MCSPSARFSDKYKGLYGGTIVNCEMKGKVCVCVVALCRKIREEIVIARDGFEIFRLMRYDSKLDGDISLDCNCFIINCRARGGPNEIPRDV